MNSQPGYPQMGQWGPGQMGGPMVGAPGFPAGYQMNQQLGFSMGTPAGYGFPAGMPQAGLGMGAQFGMAQTAQMAQYPAPYAQPQQPLQAAQQMAIFGQGQAFQQQLATGRFPAPVAAPANMAQAGPASMAPAGPASMAPAGPASMAPVGPASIAIAAPGKWAVPDNIVRKESYQFSLLDRQRQGFLTRGEMQGLLARTNLPAPALAAIWELTDLKRDAQFCKEQYVLAMYLVDQARSGRPLPTRLPDDLVPPNLRPKISAAALTAGPQPGPALVPAPVPAAAQAQGAQGLPAVLMPQVTTSSNSSEGTAALGAATQPTAQVAAIPDASATAQAAPATAPTQPSKSLVEMSSMAAFLGLQMPAPKPQPQPAPVMPAAPAVVAVLPALSADGTGLGAVATATPTPAGTGMTPEVAVAGAPQAAAVAAAVPAPAAGAAPDYTALSALSGASGFSSEVSRADAAQRLIEERRRGLDDFYEEERRARQKHNEEEAERERKRLEAVRLREQTERLLEEERIRVERLREVLIQFEPQKAQEMAAYQQESYALQNAKSQAEALKARKEELTRLSEEQKAASKAATDLLRDAPQREERLKMELAELSQQLERAQQERLQTRSEFLELNAELLLKNTTKEGLQAQCDSLDVYLERQKLDNQEVDQRLAEARAQLMANEQQTMSVQQEARQKRAKWETQRRSAAISSLLGTMSTGSSSTGTGLGGAQGPGPAFGPGAGAGKRVQFSADIQSPSPRTTSALFVESTTEYRIRSESITNKLFGAPPELNNATKSASLPQRQAASSYVVANYAFNVARRGYLRVEKGDVLLVASRALKDWTAAQNLTALAAGQSRAPTVAQTVGIVPAAYVRAANEADLNALYGSTGPSSAAPSQLASLLAPPQLVSLSDSASPPAVAASGSTYQSLLDDLSSTASAFEQAVLANGSVRDDLNVNFTLSDMQQFSNGQSFDESDLLNSGPELKPLQTQSSVNNVLSLVNTTAYKTNPAAAAQAIEAKRTVSLSSTASKDTEPEGEDAVAIGDFTATTDTQLSFREGQHIRILGRDTSGWWQASIEVEKAGRKETKYGWVPNSYVEIVPVAAPKARKSQGGRSDSVSSQSLSNAPARKNTQTFSSATSALSSTGISSRAAMSSRKNTMEGGKRAMAMYSFNAETENELSITEGQELLIVATAEGDWLIAKYKGQQGLVPAAYVEYL